MVLTNKKVDSPALGDLLFEEFEGKLSISS